MSRNMRLLENMERMNIESLFINNEKNIRYLSGYTGEDSYILISKDGKWFITDYRYSEQAHAECIGYEIVVRNRQTTSLGECIQEILSENKINSMGFERDHINYGMIEDIKACTGAVNVIPTLSLIEPLRYTKDSDEITLIKKACEIGDIAFSELLKIIRVGMTEEEAALELEYKMRKNGAEGLAFDTILLSGARSSMPHGLPSDKIIEHGDFVTIDFGALYKGYRSDMTRTFVMGEATDEQKAVYASVLEAQKTGVSAVKNGVLGSVVDDRVKDVLVRDNYYEYAGKGLGHGIGLDLHEQPFMSPICGQTLEKGCIVTVEPGVYIPGWGGVRIEDTVVVTENACEIITHTPKELLIIK